MTREEIRQGIGGQTALICTLLGEAGGEPIEGQVAVACVIRNRVRHPRWWGKDWYSVCLAKAQFSCWWESGANSDRVYALAEALALGQAATGGQSLVGQLHWIAAGVMDDMVMDPTRGADHYLTAALYRSAACPSWAKGKPVTAAIGGHVFQRLET